MVDFYKQNMDSYFMKKKSTKYLIDKKFQVKCVSHTMTLRESMRKSPLKFFEWEEKMVVPVSTYSFKQSLAIRYNLRKASEQIQKVMFRWQRIIV